MKQIYVMGEPIDLVPAETFKVDLNFPSVDTQTFLIYYLDGQRVTLLEPEPLCQCPIKTLMESGCQCGGD